MEVLAFSMQQTLNTQLIKHYLNLHKLIFLPFSIISIFTSEGLRSYDSSQPKSYQLTSLGFNKMCSVPCVPESITSLSFRHALSPLSSAGHGKQWSKLNLHVPQSDLKISLFFLCSQKVYCQKDHIQFKNYPREFLLYNRMPGMEISDKNFWQALS